MVSAIPNEFRFAMRDLRGAEVLLAEICATFKVAGPGGIDANPDNGWTLTVRLPDDSVVRHELVRKFCNGFRMGWTRAHAELAAA